MSGFFKKLVLQGEPVYQLLKLPYAILKGCFLTGCIIQAPPGILLFPMLKKPWGDLITTYELGRSANAAEQLFDNLAFEFYGEPSSELHGTILSLIFWNIGSCRLL
jgi:hypothetical protein